jgi:hypothetical protein
MLQNSTAAVSAMVGEASHRLQKTKHHFQAGLKYEVLRLRRCVEMCC